METQRLTESQITVRCVECNKLIRRGEPLDEHVSHGYCEDCYTIAIRELDMLHIKCSI